MAGAGGGGGEGRGRRRKRWTHRCSSRTCSFFTFKQKTIFVAISSFPPFPRSPLSPAFAFCSWRSHVDTQSRPAPQLIAVVDEALNAGQWSTPQFSPSSLDISKLRRESFFPSFNAIFMPLPKRSLPIFFSSSRLYSY